MMETQAAHAQFMGLPDTPAPALEHLYSFDQWCDYGVQLAEYQSRLGEYVKAYQLLIGDWINYGISHWQRPAEREIKALGFSRETADNFAWVARRIPESLRGDEKATFEDYRTVAALDSPKERAEWLEKKRANEWSGRELRRQIAAARGKPIAPTSAAARVTFERGAMEKLIEELCTEGTALLAMPDAISQAQGDVKLDCAARLRKAVT